MLLCWLQMRALGGDLILRIEDVDSRRVRPGAEEAILHDLRWLGFDWDEGPDCAGAFGPYRQSDRTALYEEALRSLGELVFPCVCTRREVRSAAGLSADHRGEIRYPGTCRSRSAPPEGREYSQRLRIEPETLSWSDLWLGPMSEDPSTVCGDVILRSKNGDFTYQLACAYDDVAMGVTHVLRGADLVDSTGRQLLLHRHFGADQSICFAHTPLRVDKAGQRLAKSRGSLGLGELRASGERPGRLIAALAFDLGLSDEEEVELHPSELLQAFTQRMPQLC